MKLLLKKKKRFESPPMELLSIFRMMERMEEKCQSESKISVARILVEMHRMKACDRTTMEREQIIIVPYQLRRMKACDQEPTGAKVHDEPDLQAKYEALLARNKEIEMRIKEIEMKLKGMEEEEKKK